jgi:hypothetical protein
LAVAGASGEPVRGLMVRRSVSRASTMVGAVKPLRRSLP